MAIKEQLLPMMNIIIRPKETLKNLPSDKFYIVGFFISAYFSYASVSRNGGLDAFQSKASAFVVFSMMCIIFYVITAFIIKIIILIFGKRLSVKKVMNIVGYSQAPRLLLSLPISLLLLLLPYESKIELFFSIDEGGVISVIAIIVSIVGALLLFYSLFLLIWGFIVSEENQVNEPEPVN